MTPSRIREKVVAEKTAWIREMMGSIKRLPLDSKEIFLSDWRNTAAAESSLRRGLEALMDLGRHILAKGFGQPVAEYKDIPRELSREGVLNDNDANLMKELAGYRNRMVHFYNEISNEELYRICSQQLEDVGKVLNALLAWINSHPELVDRSL